MGCYQISLLYHPQAFDSLEQAFDPVANAEYAARFLAALKSRTGSWSAAVAAYHSTDPLRGGPYRERVLAGWPDATPGPGPAEAIGPVTFPGFPGVKLWLPHPPDSASVVVVVGDQTKRALPEIIVPP